MKLMAGSGKGFPGGIPFNQFHKQINLKNRAAEMRQA
jgi:hypothetical protein